jgi:hypothetical protein
MRQKPVNITHGLANLDARVYWEAESLKLFVVVRTTHALVAGSQSQSSIM